MISAGAPTHIPFAQACELAAGIAALPVGHQMNAACSVRTAAAASYALQTGVPASALRIVGNFLPQLSAQALRGASRDEEPILQRATVFSDASFLDRLFACRSASIRADREVDLHGVRLTHGLYVGQPSMFIKADGSAHRWAIREPFSRARFYNHHALAVRTPNPLSGRVETMPIDAACDESQPQSMSAWRSGQHHAGAIPTVATIGGPFTLDVANMDTLAAHRLAGLLSMPLASRPALERRLDELTGLQRLLLLRTFFYLGVGDGALQAGQMPISPSDFFDAYSHRLAQVVTVETAIVDSPRNLGDPAFLQERLNILKPLEQAQDWLLATNDAPAGTAG